MPIYEYECEKCGHQTEVWQKFSDPPVAECDQCHTRMKKLISHSSFHLKGSGWYVTDYASKSSCSNTPSGAGESRKEPSDTSEKTSKSDAKGSSENSSKNDSAKGSD